MIPFRTAVAVAVLALPAVVTGSPAVAACGFDGVVIFGSDDEQEMACGALTGVLAYFNGLGFAIDPTVDIHFKDRVFCDFRADELSGESCTVQVSGLYDSKRRLVEMTSPDSAFRDGRQPWGVEWGPEIAYSILQHELSHMAVGEILGERFQNLSAPWHEFIAYSVQFDLMSPALRSRVMDAYPDATPFAGNGNINPVIHAIDPDAFGVRSYLHAAAHGGGQFIVDILSQAVSQGAGSGADYLWTE